MSDKRRQFADAFRAWHTYAMRDSVYLHEPVGDLRLWDPEEDNFATPRGILLQTRL